jgi:asparagine synthetase B (glutamine-hydrolysing)
VRGLRGLGAAEVFAGLHQRAHPARAGRGGEGLEELVMRELEYWMKRCERLERKLAEAQEEIGRLKGPIFVNEDERKQRTEREAER